MLGSHWQHWTSFFNMGGYAVTVWVSYVLVLGSLLGVSFYSKRCYSRVIRALRKRLEKK